ncbi:MAG: dienelactone hydrolase family protein, partial [Bryobacteraceae bacterium]
MALPKKGTGAGVVVLQEIFGVSESMRKVCDFFASRQFTAICPDLFWRAEPNVELKESEFEKARALRGKMNDDQVTDDIASAADFLRKHPACSNGSVGVVGYCWGGFLAYLT